MQLETKMVTLQPTRPRAGRRQSLIQPPKERSAMADAGLRPRHDLGGGRARVCKAVRHAA